MSELLFEYYHVPSVAYGVDGLFSYDFNHDNTSDGLVVSCGYQTTHVLPILGGLFQPAFCRRLNYGGATIDGFLQRILQLKYPGHAAVITLTRAEVRCFECTGCLQSYIIYIITLYANVSF